MLGCRKVCDKENLTLATVKDLARVNIVHIKDISFVFRHFIYCFTVFYTHPTYFSVVAKTNTNNYAETWCAYIDIKAEYTSERKDGGNYFKLSKTYLTIHNYSCN